MKVDQIETSAFTVAALRERLKKEPGTRVDLEVQDEDGVHEVVLVLEELF